MEPTIQHGDNVIVDVRAYRSGSPQYRDVVVFHKDGSFVVKRIIAIGGDTIEGRSDRIMVNGNLINESYIRRSDIQSDDEPPGYEWMHSFGPLTVPPNKYFVMGDNRNESLDSRSPKYGFADGDKIIGKVLYVYRAAREGARVR
jgi:signal peptidase I